MAIVIDGSLGEGGGQILRTALALSAILTVPVRVVNIRAGRPKPGLAAQHLVCVHATAAMVDAYVEGAALGSTSITFTPSAAAVAGRYTFAVGTAGAATLVLQAVLPIAMAATRGRPGNVTFVVEGGTHASHSPPIDFFQHTLVPCLHAIGCAVQVTVERVGLHPVGGGRIVVVVPGGWTPTPLPPAFAVPWHPAPAPLDIAVYGGKDVADVCTALRTALPTATVCTGAVVTHKTAPVIIASLPHVQNTSRGKDIVTVMADHKSMSKSKSKDTWAARVQEAVAARQRHSVPVGEELADQLLLPLALAAGGAFLSVLPSLHTTTAARVMSDVTGQELVAWTVQGDTALVTVRTLP